MKLIDPDKFSKKDISKYLYKHLGYGNSAKEFDDCAEDLFSMYSKHLKDLPKKKRQNKFEKEYSDQLQNVYSIIGEKAGYNQCLEDCTK